MASQPLRPCPSEAAAESLFINHPFPVKSSPWQGHALSLAPRYGTENIGNFSRGEDGPLCSLPGQGEQLCGRCGSQRGGRESSRDGGVGPQPRERAWHWPRGHVKTPCGGSAGPGPWAFCFCLGEAGRSGCEGGGQAARTSKSSSVPTQVTQHTQPECLE